MSRLAWLASVAIGCGQPSGTGGAKQPAHTSSAMALEDDLPRLAERMAKLYRDWKQAFAEAGTNCAAATSRMNALVDANRDLREASQRLLRAGHAKVQAFRAERAKYDTEIDANAKAIFESPTLAKCKQDAAFSRALDRLGGEE